MSTVPNPDTPTNLPDSATGKFASPDRGAPVQGTLEELRASIDQLSRANKELNDTNARLRDKIAELETRSDVQSAQRQSEEQLRNILETETVGVLFFNFDGVLIDANDVFLGMTGWSREEVASGSLHWQRMTPPEWIAASEEQMTRLRDTGRLGPYEKEYFRKDGSRSWMLFAGRDLGNGVVVEYAIDINDRMRAEQRLRNSEADLSRNYAWMAAQKEAFQQAINGAPLETSLGVLVQIAVEQAEAECRCAFYIADASGTRLHHIVGMPASYAEQVDGLELSPESLACSLAVATGAPVVTPDVLDDVQWQPWQWLAREHDFRGCCSFPLETSSGRLVGSFAMYFKYSRTPTPRDLALAASVTQTASIIISRHEAATG